MSLPLNNHISFAMAIPNFLQFLLISFLCIILFVHSSQAANVVDSSVNESSQFEANDFYQALAAEMYNQSGDQSSAVDYYYELSANNADPVIAKRVTELATVTGQIVKALDGAKRWVVVDPESLEANQYLALLLIRNSRFTSAAAQLDSIRNLIEKTSITEADSTSIDVNNYSFKTSESLTFIGAMLTAESHHDKAFEVFNLYIKNHAQKLTNFSQYKKQQQLISAQLAMKAKKYEQVVSFLDGLNDLDAQNHVDAKVMLAKALHKLQRNDEAIQHLKVIQDLPEANDSHRLELVRLLVLNKQKDRALPILEMLVSKHPKNFELLKSLIALEINQSMLINVSKNIKLLKANEMYLNEAEYFAGEFAEKLGQQEKALSSFSKVEGGSYIKNAHKKTISLTKKIEGQDALSAFFNKKQKNAKTIRDQAYWIKLQADDLFENYQYSSALNLYNRAVTLSPKKSRYRYKRGLVHERMGDIQLADTDFNYVLSKRKNDYETLNALGYMLSVHTSRLTEAKTLIKKAFTLKPNDPLVLDSMGFVLYKSGELDKAEKYLRKAFNLMKKPEVASHLITVLAELNQYQEANNIYQEMVKIYPNSPSLKAVANRLP